MAISATFAIKHIRPFEDGFEPFCSVDMISFLYDE